MEQKLKTSNDAYAEYTKLREMEEKLMKNNKGFNLLGDFNPKKPKGFSIKLMVESRVNLKGKEEKINVSSDLPFNRWSYSYYSNNTKTFLDRLIKYCKSPIYKYPRQRNRRTENNMSMWNMPKFRDKKILFEDINFIIGEKAEGMLYEDKLDFVGEVKEILETQKETTEEQKNDFDNYFLLCEKIDDLDRQLKPIKERYSYSSYSSEGKDKTLTMTITKQEYNDRLKVLEDELNTLCNKYEILTMPRMSYQEIITLPSLKDWSDENEEDLRDCWDNELNDEDKEEYDGDFDKFIKFKYEEYSDMTDFDEGSDDDEYYENDE